MRRTAMVVTFGLGAATLAAPPLRAQEAPPGADFGGGAANAEELQRLRRLEELRLLEFDTRVRANTAIPPGQRLLLDYGAYASFNVLDLDDPEGENHILRETEGIGYARLNIDGVHEFFLRGRIGWRDFNEGDSFDGRGDEPIDGDLDRGFYRFDLNRSRTAYGKQPLDYNVAVQGGRDLVYWANGLVLAQVLDGGVLDYSNERFALQLVAGVTPTRTVDFDTSRPEFDHDTRRGFYGGMLTLNVDEQRPFVYFLAQQDYNQADQRSIGFIDTEYEYNSYYVGLGSVGSLGGNLRYGVEAAYEFGGSLSTSFVVEGFSITPIEQTNDPISAWALDARLDYFFTDARQSRLSGEIIVASGDDDRGHTSNTFNGNAPNTDDRAFNAFGLVNTGLAFAPDVSNLIALRGGYSTFPFPDTPALRRLQVGVDVFVFGKYDDDAPIDEPVGDNRYLGWEPDLYLNWQLTSDVTLALRYGLFIPNDDNFAVDEERHFFFGGVTFAF